MDISSADIKLILTALQEAGFDQAEVVVGDVHITVARRGARLAALAEPTPECPSPAPITPQPTAVAPEPPAPVSDTAGDVRPATSCERVVTSPSVGVFRRSSQPGGIPFIQVGDTINVGDTLGIVEVARLKMPVEAQTEGVVTAIAAQDASAVEYGTALVTITS